MKALISRENDYISDGTAGQHHSIGHYTDFCSCIAAKFRHCFRGKLLVLHNGERLRRGQLVQLARGCVGRLVRGCRMLELLYRGGMPCFCRQQKLHVAERFNLGMVRASKLLDIFRNQSERVPEQLCRIELQLVRGVHVQRVWRLWRANMLEHHKF